MKADRTWHGEGTIVPEADPSGPLPPVFGEGGGPAEPARSPLEPPWQARMRLGAFELVRRLGEGATGEVWEAVDRRYDAPVAVKLFSAKGGSATMERVMAEARAASRVVSDHVVYVRDAGRIEGGGPYYLAMALCREETEEDAAPVVARSLIDDPPRSLVEAVRWGEQIARGVAAAHAQRVYHRDLKPENVLCLPRSRQVRILDFGLASLAEGGASAAPTRPTQTLFMRGEDRGNFVAGTPAYMAPEQARGFTRPPDPEHDGERLVALDVYGIGATLWALLAGRPPHAPVDQDLGPLEVVARAATVRVPPLDRVKGRFPVPPRLARIVARAMASDPARRYPSAAALAVDLARFAARRPTSLDAPWAPVRATLFLHRHPGLAGIAGYFLLMAVGASAMVAVYRQLGEAYAELGAVGKELADTRDEVRTVTERAEEQEQRAADAVNTLSARAESAEEHIDRLRRYAASESVRADESVASAQLATAAATAATERATQAEAQAAEANARAAQADTLAAEARARADRSDAAATDAIARAEAAVEAKARAEAQAAEAQRASQAAQAQVAELKARAADAEARARAAEARAEAAEAKVADALAQEPVPAP